MNLEKSKKRIAKKVKMGFQGYPQISLSYYDASADSPSGVLIEFILEEGADTQEERLSSKGNAAEDEVIQSAIVKMIERSDAKTVLMKQG